MPLTLPSVPSEPAKLVKSTLAPVWEKVPPIVKVCPPTTFQAWRPLASVRPQLSVRLWLAEPMLMPLVPSVSVLPLAMVSGPFMVPSSCRPPKVRFPPKVIAARFPVETVASNSPISVADGAALQSTAPPFIVVVSNLMTLAACPVK